MLMGAIGDGGVFDISWPLGRTRGSELLGRWASRNPRPPLGRSLRDIAFES